MLAHQWLATPHCCTPQRTRIILQPAPSLRHVHHIPRRLRHLHWYALSRRHVHHIPRRAFHLHWCALSRRHVHHIHQARISPPLVCIVSPTRASHPPGGTSSPLVCIVSPARASHPPGGTSSPLVCTITPAHTASPAYIISIDNAHHLNGAHHPHGRTCSWLASCGLPPLPARLSNRPFRPFCVCPHGTTPVLVPALRAPAAHSWLHLSVVGHERPAMHA